MKYIETTDAMNVLRRAPLPDDVRSAVNIILAANQRLRVEIEHLLNQLLDTRSLPDESGYYRVVSHTIQPLDSEVVLLTDKGNWCFVGSGSSLTTMEMKRFLIENNARLVWLDLELGTSKTRNKPFFQTTIVKSSTANGADRDPSSDRKRADETEEPSPDVQKPPWIAGLRYRRVYY